MEEMTEIVEDMMEIVKEINDDCGRGDMIVEEMT